MADVTTLDRVYWPLMDGPSIKQDQCVVCGRTDHLEQHHVVPRSAGQFVRDGIVVPKPTLTLCGFGNCLSRPPELGRGPWRNRHTYYCHGASHHEYLHFNFFDGLWHYTWTSEPRKHYEVLMDPEAVWMILPFVDDYGDIYTPIF